MRAATSPAELERRVVGRTDVAVTCLGMGGGALGGMYTTVAADAAMDAVHEAYVAGVRYFDTAPLYGHGRSEERVGEALAAYDRSSFVLSTKVGVAIEPLNGEAAQLEERYADPFLLDGGYDFSYDGTMRSLEGSMRRLGTDRVDIVYIHDPDEADSAVPPEQRSGANHFDEVMEGAYPALHELRSQGVVRALGVGLNGTEMLADFARAGDFDCFLLAGRYTLLEQEGLETLFPLCRQRGISIVAGGVFNSGILATGTSFPEPKYNYMPADPHTLVRVRRIEEICARHDVSLSAAALQFPLANDVVAAVLPGVRSWQEVRVNVANVTATIPDQFWADIAANGDLLDARAPLPSTVSS
ncbi:MAG: aldo/keto reductase [Solirubrobacteraceae bacterium]